MAISPVRWPLTVSIAAWRAHDAVNFLSKVLMSPMADTESVKKSALELAIKSLAALWPAL